MLGSQGGAQQQQLQEESLFLLVCSAASQQNLIPSRTLAARELEKWELSLAASVMQELIFGMVASILGPIIHNHHSPSTYLAESQWYSQHLAFTLCLFKEERTICGKHSMRALKSPMNKHLPTLKGGGITTQLASGHTPSLLKLEVGSKEQRDILADKRKDERRISHFE